MKIVAPDYYPDFACIAGACRHNCCVGWEIDIDPAAMALYARTPGEFGQRLLQSIDASLDPPCFRLTEQGRCPLLNRDGLCDVILNLGHDALCQICADHPRFRNYYADRVEIGLGMCCEAAAALILRRPAPLRLTVLEDDGRGVPDPEEVEILSFRGRLLSILEDDSAPIDRRLDAVARECEAPACRRSFADWARFLRGLERLDDAWLADLEQLAAFRPPWPEAWGRPLANLCAYFLYRHLPGALEDGRLAERGSFAVLATRLLWAMCARPEAALADLEERARRFSAEIEYSDENLEAILETLEHE